MLGLKQIAKSSILVLTVILAACSKNDDKPDSLNQAMKDAGNPNYEILTNLLIQRHARAAASTEPSKSLAPAWSLQDYQQALRELAPADVATRSPWDTKVAVEAKLKEKNGGAELPYNQDHVTIASPLRMGKLQCYSGSILNLLVMRQMNAQDFLRQNMVMIFTPGHVLPGFMVAEGDSFRLVGVETTVSGKGRVDFGLAKDLKGAIRVVDAEAFVQVEALAEALPNEAEVRDWAILKTAKLYGIPLETTEPSAKAVGGNDSSDPTTKINASMFAFGTPSNSTSGDRVRNSADEVPANPNGAYTTDYVHTASIPKAPPQEFIVAPGQIEMNPHDFSSPLEQTELGAQMKGLNQIYRDIFPNRACTEDPMAKAELKSVFVSAAEILSTFESSVLSGEYAGRAIEAAHHHWMKENDAKYAKGSENRYAACLVKEGLTECEIAYALNPEVIEPTITRFKISLREKRVVHFEVAASHYAQPIEGPRRAMRAILISYSPDRKEVPSYSDGEVFSAEKTFTGIDYAKLAQHEGDSVRRLNVVLSGGYLIVKATPREVLNEPYLGKMWMEEKNRPSFCLN